MLSPEERLEGLEKVLAELEELSEKLPVIVEGNKDIAALKRLGITKNVVSLSRGDSIFAFCEKLSKKSREVVILTDWDRKGGHLARMLKEALETNGVSVNDRVRTQLVVLLKKEVKDIESMPTFIERLRYQPSGSARKTPID
ncbi:MAG: toprim domain-containing protein [Thermoplasmata archaeon]